METRKGHSQKTGRLTQSSELPADFLALVKEVLTGNFGDGLKALSKFKADPEFVISGGIFSDEIVLGASIVHPNQLAATTVFASVDFDPKASSPTAQDLLAACLDALGGLFETILDPKKPQILEQVADESLSALENVPFEWTSVEVDRYKIYLKLDKSNPSLDQLADQWLSKHDPDLQQLEEQNEKDTEALFVTGPKKTDKMTH